MRGYTYRVSKTTQVGAAIVEPLKELLTVIRWVALAVGGHAEDTNGVFNFVQLAQVLHFTLLRISDHGLHAVTRCLLRQSSRKLFRCTRL